MLWKIKDHPSDVLDIEFNEDGSVSSCFFLSLSPFHTKIEILIKQKERKRRGSILTY